MTRVEKTTVQSKKTLLMARKTSCRGYSVGAGISSRRLVDKPILNDLMLPKYLISFLLGRHDQFHNFPLCHYFS